MGHKKTDPTSGLEFAIRQNSERPVSDCHVNPKAAYLNVLHPGNVFEFTSKRGIIPGYRAGTCGKVQLAVVDCSTGSHVHHDKSEERFEIRIKDLPLLDIDLVKRQQEIVKYMPSDEERWWSDDDSDDELYSSDSSDEE